ncbi:FtsX-like permease family protein [Haloarcula sp. CBA1130]|uniref:ABC transporter permease n=1 Tax=unclassified Haloarcula TaxID=2624677 RepID=UPI0012474203|nr:MULTISPECIES: FtsX-like permease family protein [unclassified Haloarcula]KAA9397215.1 FtsX-like permease family protein [Haloarcula sp. CBA1129]KAA9402749.1 FtsX-like permease family protein [Haloarcula sp. CBA1130]
MDTGESVRITLRSIKAHKLRSALTVVGVVIGIASVITFATFGASVEAEIVGDIETSNAGNIYVFGTPSGDDDFDRTLQPVFTEYDIQQLEAITGVQAVLPRGIVQTQSVRHGNQTLARQQVTAVRSASINDGVLVEGRSFEADEEAVVVNERMAGSFAENLTTGERFTMTMADGSERNVTVVGVVNGTRGEVPVSEFARQPRVYVPIDPFYDSVVESPSAGVRQRAYPQVTLAVDPRAIPETQSAIQTYLSGESDARSLSADDTELVARSGNDFVEEISDVIERITRFVTGIAVIALVVGAIGIANVMLVSVTERTREIGIMKAVGARNRDVMQVFLVEAALLGTLGSLLGVPLGLLVGYGATRYAEVAFSLAPLWIALAVGVGVLVGVVAGLYPAWRAARVDPIDALRHE